MRIKQQHTENYLDIYMDNEMYFAYFIHYNVYVVKQQQKNS